MCSSDLRNVIINGDFSCWQRGTSGFGTTDGTYTADRWRHTSSGLTITQDTDVPTGFRYSAKLVGTGDNSFAQRIESANSTRLVSQKVTLSFYAKRTSGSGALDVRFYYPSAADNYASVTQIGSTIVVSNSPSSSWTLYKATITLPANVSNGLMVLINNVGASTTFITGVQLEVGDTATPFEFESFADTLRKCQRYYRRWTVSDAVGTWFASIPPGYPASASSAYFTISLNPEMRIAPALEIGRAHV